MIIFCSLSFGFLFLKLTIQQLYWYFYSITSCDFYVWLLLEVGHTQVVKLHYYGILLTGNLDLFKEAFHNIDLI